MSETDVDPADLVNPRPEPEATDGATEAAAEPVIEQEMLHCRWCGTQQDVTPSVDGEDWLCLHCERYQDAMICPTCKQLARVSTLPAEMVPEAHTPVRRRRTKD